MCAVGVNVRGEFATGQAAQRVDPHQIDTDEGYERCRQPGERHGEVSERVLLAAGVGLGDRVTVAAGRRALR